MLTPVGTGCFISTGRSLEPRSSGSNWPSRSATSAVYVTHIAGRESLTVLTAYALSTSRSRSGPASCRSTRARPRRWRRRPSHGRALRRALHARARRLPPSGRRGLARPDDRPAGGRDARVRVDRARDLRRRGPAAGGEVADGLPPVSASIRAELPIYIAALSPAMLRLAGEIADGVILWLCNPAYIERGRDPGGADGTRAGRQEGEGFDIVAAVPAALTDDRGDAAYRAMRKDLIPTSSLPFYRAMIERTGFGADIEALRRRRRRPAGDAERDLRRLPRRADRGRATARCSPAASSDTAPPGPARPASARYRAPISRRRCARGSAGSAATRARRPACALAYGPTARRRRRNRRVTNGRRARL